MSSNFNANQYEGAFNPQRLQNYEIPAPPKKQWPITRYGSTSIISNDKGHIVDENKRSPSSPWGSFVGTWQAGRKPIQLMTRTKLRNNFSNIQYITNNKATTSSNEADDTMATHTPVKSPQEGEVISPNCADTPGQDMDAQTPLDSRPPTCTSEN